MILYLFAAGLMVLSGGVAYGLRRNPGMSTWIGAGGAAVGCLTASISAVGSLLQPSIRNFQINWNLPFGSFHCRLDALSAWFLLPILGLSLLAAIYGIGYMAAWHGRKNVGASWFFFNVLVASMGFVVLARDGILFLISWEIMSLSSFFLVTFEDEKKSVRDAGWTYLVATHAGTACLLALFVCLGRANGSFDFDHWRLTGTSAMSGVLFLLAIVGFGTKAGFMPFHIWLPDAHPAAPSHVSAVMSGVMIKTGIYGLARMLTLCDSPPAWWGWSLIAIGVSSGLLGVLFALAQHDLKRLLAYHSIENIGIIALGFGIGLLGLSQHSAVLTALGFSGGLLHVFNHALFKGLLFFGAGSVAHSMGTLDIEHLGGLIKRMPWTGATFLIGAAAIAGLPPFNGFISEFLIYMGAAKGLLEFRGPTLLCLIIVVLSLTLIGGLALACFTKAFGIIFLGQPRSHHLREAHEAPWEMRVPMVLLSAGCLLVGLTAPWLLSGLRPVVEIVSQSSGSSLQTALADVSRSLSFVVRIVIGFLASTLILWSARSWLLRGRTVTEGVTWDCGYMQPTPRMQYTASSFAQPLTALFRLVLRTKIKISPFSTSTPDIFTENFFRPIYHGIRFGFSKLRWFQHGRLQAYILYIGLTLLILLIWNLR